MDFEGENLGNKNFVVVRVLVAIVNSKVSNYNTSRRELRGHLLDLFKNFIILL